MARGSGHFVGGSCDAGGSCNITIAGFEQHRTMPKSNVVGTLVKVFIFMEHPG